MPVYLMRYIGMQPIRVERAPGTVELAVMHTVDMDASTEDLRLTAMHLRSPIHTLMFNSSGIFHGGNDAAINACHAHAPGMYYNFVLVVVPQAKCLAFCCTWHDAGYTAHSALPEKGMAVPQ